MPVHADLGKWVVVDAGGGWTLRYAHLSTVTVANGPVTAATEIGLVGDTGNAVGSHLHYEQRLNDAPMPVTFGGTSAPAGTTFPGNPHTSANCGGAVLTNGSFVTVQGTSEVYRIIGGAALYVSTWSPFGGPQSTTSISPTQLNSLPRYPADGTFVKSGQTGENFRIVGGAPIYISSWDPFGGPQPSTTIDQAAIDNAGTGGPNNRWNHLTQRPADGTFIAAGTGQKYRIIGGAPIYISSWDPFGGPQPSTTIDQAAIDNAGTGGPNNRWNHLTYTPTDDTWVTSAQTGQPYRFLAGYAYAQPSPAPPLTTAIDQAAIDNAGTGGSFNVWNHISGVVF